MVVKEYFKNNIPQETLEVRKDTYASAFSQKDEETDKESFFIKMSGGKMYDPFDANIMRCKAYNWKYRRVPENVFKKYLQYLEHKRKAYLIQAERSI